MKSSQRKHVMAFGSSAILLLLLQLIDLSLGLQQSHPTCTAFVRPPISLRQQSNFLRSVSVADDVGETISDNILTEEDQQTQPAYEWDEQFEELQSFMSEYGHCNFPQNPSNQLKKKYPTLMTFCKEQRQEFKRLLRNKRQSRIMTLLGFDRDVRMRRLGELGFEFNLIKAQWYDHYHELMHYANDNGDTRVARSSNLMLNTWAYKQRSRRKGSESFPKLTGAQIKLLDNIGFDWQLHDKLWDYEQWNSKYKELVAFRKKHGNFLVPLENPLSSWIYVQRDRHAGKRGRTALTDEQLSLLDEIEFPWEAERYQSKWQTKYNELQRFQMKHGHCQPLPQSSLRFWCNEQRRKYRSDILSKEQIKLLEKLDFPWDTTRKWDDIYEELCEFFKEHGHLRVSQDSDSELYDWVSVQRERYHGIVQPQMSNQQIEKLEDTNFCFALDWRERTWYEKYSEVVEYFKEHSSVRVTKKENPSLYNWIETQGKRYMEVKGQKPLSEEELELLEQLDFSFLDDQPRMAWNAMYAKLERYRDENVGRFPTSHKNDPGLNRWLRQQRHRYRCAYGHVALSDDQKVLLESIDFPIYPEGKRKRSWYEKYDELVEFRKEHGHFLVDKSDNPSLHDWIITQRLGCKGREATNRKPLSKLQIYLLDRIGLPPASDRNEIQWQEMYKQLVEFEKEHGHIRVPSSNCKLLYWTNRQRQRYKGNTHSDLSEYQINQLEEIGFEWSLR